MARMILQYDLDNREALKDPTLVSNWQSSANLKALAQMGNFRVNFCFSTNPLRELFSILGSVDLCRAREAIAFQG
ncbi:MAG: hypothetical protein Ct9H300mP15_24140 [Gemmatimonadota bacterium]|nr:MAG: hypothetical protein Ct9H300mP15_24140 [Gemmatimonadota bacterium]